MIISNPKLEGQVGESAVWDGPLSKEGFPMGVGRFKAGPITQRAKGL